MKRIPMLLAVVAGAIGLSVFAVRIWRSGAGTVTPDITFQTKVVLVGAPQRMLDFARAHPDISSQDELERLLGGRRVAYIVVFRTYQRIGFRDLPIPNWLGETPPAFSYTRDILLTLTGRPPEIFTDAMIEIIEDDKDVEPTAQGSRNPSEQESHGWNADERRGRSPHHTLPLPAVGGRTIPTSVEIHVCGRDRSD